MGQQVQGGIVEHRELERFTASAANVAVKDQIDLMARNCFSLTPGRTEPIVHEFTNAKTGQLETIRVTGSAEHGIATMHDQDLIIFVISQWLEARRLDMLPSRRVAFVPYQFFSWIGVEPQGKAYQRLKDALHRLKTTNIETTLRAASGRKNRSKQFSWISEWQITEENGRIKGVEVVMAEWLFESALNFQVLTIDKRYFGIQGGIERWLYLYAQKATGRSQWRETCRSLHRKSASEQGYKHYAATLRKLVKRNALPGLHLETCKSTKGEAMLLMVRREKESQPEERKPPELIERTPLEDAWENVYLILRKQLGASTANSWFKHLRPLREEGGVIWYQAPSRFVADWISSTYKRRLFDAWERVGIRVTDFRFDVTKTT